MPPAEEPPPGATAVSPCCQALHTKLQKAETSRGNLMKALKVAKEKMTELEVLKAKHSSLQETHEALQAQKSEQANSAEKLQRQQTRLHQDLHKEAQAALAECEKHKQLAEEATGAAVESTNQAKWLLLQHEALAGRQKELEGAQGAAQQQAQRQQELQRRHDDLAAQHHRLHSALAASQQLLQQHCKEEQQLQQQHKLLKAKQEALQADVAGTRREAQKEARKVAQEEARRVAQAQAEQQTQQQQQQQQQGGAGPWEGDLEALRQDVERGRQQAEAAEATVLRMQAEHAVTARRQQLQQADMQRTCQQLVSAAVLEQQQQAVQAAVQEAVQREVQAALAAHLPAAVQDAVGEALREMHKKVERVVTKKVGIVKAEVAEAQVAVEELREQHADHQSAVDELERRFDGLNARISAIHSALSELDDEVADLPSVGGAAHDSPHREGQSKRSKARASGSEPDPIKMLGLHDTSSSSGVSGESDNLHSLHQILREMSVDRLPPTLPPIPDYILAMSQPHPAPASAPSASSPSARGPSRPAAARAIRDSASDLAETAARIAPRKRQRESERGLDKEADGGDCGPAASSRDDAAAQSSEERGAVGSSDVGGHAAAGAAERSAGAGVGPAARGPPPARTPQEHCAHLLDRFCAQRLWDDRAIQESAAALARAATAAATPHLPPVDILTTAFALAIGRWWGCTKAPAKTSSRWAASDPAPPSSTKRSSPAALVGMNSWVEWREQLVESSSQGPRSARSGGAGAALVSLAREVQAHLAGARASTSTSRKDQAEPSDLLASLRIHLVHVAVGSLGGSCGPLASVWLDQVAGWQAAAAVGALCHQQGIMSAARVFVYDLLADGGSCLPPASSALSTTPLAILALSAISACPSFFPNASTELPQGRSPDVSQSAAMAPLASSSSGASSSAPLLQRAMQGILRGLVCMEGPGEEHPQQPAARACLRAMAAELGIAPPAPEPDHEGAAAGEGDLLGAVVADALAVVTERVVAQCSESRLGMDSPDAVLQDPSPGADMGPDGGADKGLRRSARVRGDRALAARPGERDKEGCSTSQGGEAGGMGDLETDARTKKRGRYSGEEQGAPDERPSRRAAADRGSLRDDDVFQEAALSLCLAGVYLGWQWVYSELISQALWRVMCVGPEALEAVSIMFGLLGRQALPCLHPAARADPQMQMALSEIRSRLAGVLTMQRDTGGVEGGTGEQAADVESRDEVRRSARVSRGRGGRVGRGGGRGAPRREDPESTSPSTDPSSERPECTCTWNAQVAAAESLLMLDTDKSDSSDCVDKWLNTLPLEAVAQLPETLASRYHETSRLPTATA